MSSYSLKGLVCLPYAVDIMAVKKDAAYLYHWNDIDKLHLRF